ncbi:MAG: serine hydrolase domain-containing protein [Desulfonatronovibrio sp.]
MFPGSYSFRSALLSSFVFFAVLLLLSCGGGSSDSQDNNYESYSLIKEMSQEVLEADENAALSFALMADGDILWTQTFGYADKATQTPVTKETMFGIGSVSKVFTAAAVMKLVDQGLMDLDTPLTAYLPDFQMLSPEYTDITIRMLLNHSSGLPGSSYRGSMTDRPWPEYQEISYQSITQSRLKHTPGFMNVYCNDGFTLAELAVQAVTGIPFTQFVEEELFKPLEMTRSKYATSPFAEGSFARAYHESTGLPMENTNLYGAGGIVSTPEDLVRFMAMISNRGIVNGTTLISESSLNAMEENQTSDTFRVVNTDLLAFGLGWDNVSHPGPGSLGKKALTKNGGTLVYSSEFWVLPEENIGFAVVAVNAPHANLAEMAEKAVIAALVDKKILAEIPEPIARQASPRSSPPENLLETVTGYYADYQSFRRVTEQPENQLQIDSRDEDTWNPEFKNLNYQENGRFASEDAPGIEFSFITDAGRQYMVMHRFEDYYDAVFPLAQQLPKGSPFTPAWEKRLKRTWILANDIPWSYFHFFNESPRMKLIAEDGLPGHLFAGGEGEYSPVVTDQNNELAQMDLLIPIANGRDLSDLEIINKGGEEWLKLSGFLYRPLETVPAVMHGTQTQLIIQEKYQTEWLRLEQAGTEADMTLSGPDNARWIVWDEQFNQVDRGWGQASIALSDQGGPYYVALYGEPGQTLDVSWQ